MVVVDEDIDVRARIAAFVAETTVDFWVKASQFVEERAQVAGREPKFRFTRAKRAQRPGDHDRDLVDDCRQCVRFPVRYGLVPAVAAGNVFRPSRNLAGSGRTHAVCDRKPRYSSRPGETSLSRDSAPNPDRIRLAACRKRRRLAARVFWASQVAGGRKGGSLVRGKRRPVPNSREPVCFAEVGERGRRLCSRKIPFVGKSGPGGLAQRVPADAPRPAPPRPASLPGSRRHCPLTGRRGGRPA